MDSNDLLDICPFSSLLNITPTDDDFFKYVKHDCKFDLLNNSERVENSVKHNIKFSMDGQDFKKMMISSCGIKAPNSVNHGLYNPIESGIIGKFAWKGHLKDS